MLKGTKALVLLVFSFVLISAPQAQDVKGKLFHKQEVETLFGAASTTITISRDSLETVLQNAGDNIMFMIKNNKLIIAGTDKVAFNDDSYEYAEGDIFHVFSTNIVKALLNYMNLPKDVEGNTVTPTEVSFAQRGEVLTVSYGDYVMEFSLPCPPVCH